MEDRPTTLFGKHDALEASAIDPSDVELTLTVERLRAQENLAGGVVAGLVAALAGAAVWATITAVTNFQVGWMAVGVGFLVGQAVRTVGHGFHQKFGYVGALLALFGCALGNILAVAITVATTQSTAPLLTVVLALAQAPGVWLWLLVKTGSMMDLLFYGLAGYWGYRYSINRVDVATGQVEPRA